MYTNANSVDKVDTLSFLQDQTLGINALKSQNFEIFQAMCEGKKKQVKQWDSTHQSWDQSCHQLRSSCRGRPAHRSRPAPAPEGEVV